MEGACQGRECARDGRSCCHLQAGEDALEQAAAVAAALQRLDHVFRMRHQAEHVAPFVEDAGDRVERAVGVGRLDGAPGRIDIAEDDAIVAFEAGERRLVAAIIAPPWAIGQRITSPRR